MYINERIYVIKIWDYQLKLNYANEDNINTMDGNYQKMKSMGQK